MNSLQPLTGIQPLIPTGTFASVGPRGRGPQVVVVPVYVPTAIYSVAADVAAGGYGTANLVDLGVNPSGMQIPDQYAGPQYPPDPPVTYAQLAPPATPSSAFDSPPVYSEQVVPQADNPASSYPPATTQTVPAGGSNAPGPADVSYTLLAFKDHAFFAVTDYWVENNRLSYITNYGTTGTAALDQLDLNLTLKLNNDRGVKFELHEK